MVLAIRKAFLVALMALALLLGLIGWTVRAEMSSPLHHSVRTHSTQTQVAYTCPPPPFDCT